jgi:hypothetical protein
MMKRLLWLGVGLAVGALAVRAVTKQARKLTPGGIADTLRGTVGGLGDSVRDFVDDVREGMAMREDEIHRAFADGTSLDGDDAPEWARGVGNTFYGSKLFQDQQEGDTRR